MENATKRAGRFHRVRFAPCPLCNGIAKKKTTAIQMRSAPKIEYCSFRFMVVRCPSESLLLQRPLALFLLPLPGSSDDFVDIRVRRDPTKLIHQFFRTCAQNSRVAKPPRSIPNLDLLARHFFRHAADLLHRIALAGADVVGVK